MTTTFLLRLARIVKSLAARASGVELYNDAEELVRDLEAVTQPEPAGRTITREEWHHALTAIESEHGTSKAWHHDALERIAAAWRLTVEEKPR